MRFSADDPQRGAVYDAESSVVGGTRYRSRADMEACVASVTTSDWWVGRGWPNPVRCRIAPNGWGECNHPGREGCNRCAARGGIDSRLKERWFVRFPGFRDDATEAQVRLALKHGEPIDADAWPWAWHDVVIAHELAHVSLLSEPVVYDVGHGPVFCRRHLEIVLSIAGCEVADELTRAWVAHGVRWYPPIDWDVAAGAPAPFVAIA